MFLAGLKFALGLMTGVFAVFGIVVGLIVVTEWVSGGNKKQRRSKRRMSDPARIALERRNPVLMLVRYPVWVDEPTESAHREP